MNSYGFWATIFLNLIDILILFFIINIKLRDNNENNLFIKTTYCLTLLVIDTIGGIYDNNIYVIIIMIISVSLITYMYLYFYKVGEISYKVYIDRKSVV